MPAIASIEDLRAAKKEGLDIWDMCYSSLQLRTRDTYRGHVLMKDGDELGGRISVNCGWKKEVRNS